MDLFDGCKNSLRVCKCFYICFGCVNCFLNWCIFNSLIEKMDREEVILLVFVLVDKIFVYLLLF